MKYRIEHFGEHLATNYSKIILINDNDVCIELSDLGARILAFWVPVGSGKDLINIVDGYNSPEEVFKLRGYYLGSIIGRVAGRIKNGTFKLNNEVYYLDKNNGNHHLHGGTESIDLEKWSFYIKQTHNKISVIFELKDFDGHNGYPGNVSFQVIHSLNNQNEWSIEYKIETDKDTIINPTNHVYFNLSDNEEDILNHQLQIYADKFLPVDAEGIPTNEIGQPVVNTIFDFTEGKRIGDVVNQKNEQIILNKGIDHPFILNSGIREQVILTNPEKTIAISMITDAPSVVIYTFNDIQDIDLKRPAHHSIAIEAQSLPNAINFEKVPEEILLVKNEPFISSTIYKLKSNKF